jgi:hypothetical protein
MKTFQLDDLSVILPPRIAGPSRFLIGFGKARWSALARETVGPTFVHPSRAAL